ncbi:WD repeat-containing protein 54 isoform X2 [Pristis pectinata]|uniref:WD repeat-containing protein 54 isoform X2 n=1 Tax=Pristis pectinata TaxID=685728 RepID=UPI00223DC13E|nr:WD repeat-containing protein 54 isoform X2 [Pristis pectinata]
MYKKEKSIQIKSSASALYNNLSVLPIAQKNLTYFAVIHGSLVNMVSASTDGLNFSHRQLQSKEGGLVHGTSLIMQASWCVLPSRILLVLASQKGIQMYESDGSIMVYWHAMDTPEAQTEAVFARGIAATGSHYVCVGSSTGSILVFNIPPEGTNITVSEVLEEHKDPITDIASDCSEDKGCIADLVTADDSGLLCIWKSGEDFKLIHKISSYGVTCSSVRMWSGIIAAGYGSGQIQVYDTASAAVHVEINAHARWISTLDVAPESGKLLSGAEDSFVNIWRLFRNPESKAIEVEHLHTECVIDVQVCGGKFCDPEGSAFAVTGYDLSEIIRYVQV